MTQDLSSFIEVLPKAELHLHLEGAVAPDLFGRLRRKHGFDPAGSAPPGGHWNFPDLAAFLTVYAQICEVMRDPADFREATYATLARCAASAGRYVELFFSPDAHDPSVISYAQMLDGIIAGIHDAHRDFGIVTHIIPAHNRELGLARGMRLLEKILANRRPEVIGIGLDYGERHHPPEAFVPLYAEARRHGLGVTAHAGEDGPAEYVRDAIELLGCRRIDHGYHIVDDPALLDRARELDVLFTVCPTTTLHTTPWRDLTAPDHAIRRMIEAGLRVSVNTDDPGLFDTTLNREYQLLADAFGLSPEVLTRIAANGFSHNWRPQ